MSHNYASPKMSPSGFPGVRLVRVWGYGMNGAAGSEVSILQDGEQLVDSGTVAGNTVRWVIGETESGAGAAKMAAL